MTLREQIEIYNEKNKLHVSFYNLIRGATNFKQTALLSHIMFIDVSFYDSMCGSPLLHKPCFSLTSITFVHRGLGLRV